MACEKVTAEESVIDEIASENDTLSPMDMLNAKILEMIFGYLSPVELIIIERVSKKWRELSLKSWENKKKLKFKDFGLKFPLKHIEKILQRGGKYLTHLDMEIMKFYLKIINGRLSGIKERHYPEKEIFKAVSMYCQQLVSLKLFVDENDTCPSGKHLNHLEDSIFQNLKTLEIHTCRQSAKNSFEKRLFCLIESAPTLEEFSAHCCIDGTCLLSLPKTCRKLEVHNQSLSHKILEKVLENLPNLKHLDLDGECMEPEVIGKICHKLETFIVGSYEGLFQEANSFFKDGKYNDLSLENVKTFKVKEDKTVCDDVLRDLTEKMPVLEELSMIYLEKVSDEGFRQLGEFKHLKSLDISGNDQITDETLTHLGSSLNKLEKVNCEDCKNLTCSGLLSLIDLCKNLRILNVEADKLTDEFLKSALRVVDERPINSSLIIYAGKLRKNLNVLVPRNDRQLKYNYCKIQGRDFLLEEKWGLTVPVIRYVSSSSISEEVK